MSPSKTEGLLIPPFLKGERETSGTLYFVLDASSLKLLSANHFSLTKENSNSESEKGEKKNTSINSFTKPMQSLSPLDMEPTFFLFPLYSDEALTTNKKLFADKKTEH